MEETHALTHMTYIVALKNAQVIKLLDNKRRCYCLSGQSLLMQLLKVHKHALYVLAIITSKHHASAKLQLLPTTSASEVFALFDGKNSHHQHNNFQRVKTFLGTISYEHDSAYKCK